LAASNASSTLTNSSVPIPSFIEILDTFRHDDGRMCCPCAEGGHQISSTDGPMKQVLAEFNAYLTMDPAVLNDHHRKLASMHHEKMS